MNRKIWLPLLMGVFGLVLGCGCCGVWSFGGDRPVPGPLPSSELSVSPSGSPSPEPTESVGPDESEGGEEEQVFYANCAEVRAAGVAPLHVWEPGYRSGLDRNLDGVACE